MIVGISQTSERYPTSSLIRLVDKFMNLSLDNPTTLGWDILFSA